MARSACRPNGRQNSTTKCEPVDRRGGTFWAWFRTIWNRNDSESRQKMTISLDNARAIGKIEQRLAELERMLQRIERQMRSEPQSETAEERRAPSPLPFDLEHNGATQLPASSIALGRPASSKFARRGNPGRGA